MKLKNHRLLLAVLGCLSLPCLLASAQATAGDQNLSACKKWLGKLRSLSAYPARSDGSGCSRAIGAISPHRWRNFLDCQLTLLVHERSVQVERAFLLTFQIP
jgi:hypothetical protein